MHYDHILLTGGLGQVGSYISDTLIKRGYGVTILDNESSTINPHNPKANVITGDIRDVNLVNNLVKSSDAVIHCAAQIFVSYSIENPLFDAENNIMGTLNLLNAARGANLKRFIYFSSAAIYGDPVRLPVDEQHPQDPMSPYGVSKLSGEKYAHVQQDLWHPDDLHQAIQYQ